MKKDEINLIVDLAKLLNKHRVDSFSRLLLTLSESESIQYLDSIIFAIRNDIRNDPHLLSRGASRTFRKSGRVIGKSDPKKYLEINNAIDEINTSFKEVNSDDRQAVLDTINKMKAGKILAKATDIKRILNSFGMNYKFKTRDEGIALVLNLLRSLPEKSIVDFISLAGNEDNQIDNNLERWSSLIMNSTRRK